MCEANRFQPFKLQTENDQPVGKKPAQRHARVLNFVYLFSSIHQKVSWKLGEFLSVDKTVLSGAKKLPVFNSAFQQIYVASNSSSVTGYDLDQFIGENQNVAKRIVKALDAFEFDEIDADSQYLSAINQYSDQWFQFVETEPDFLKIYRDRARLGVFATEPLAQLPASQQDEFSVAIGFSQVPETIQLSQANQSLVSPEQDHRNLATYECEFKCSNSIFTNAVSLKRHRVNEHGVFQGYKCGCCFYPFNSPTVRGKSQTNHSGFKSNLTLAESTANIIVNTVNSTIFAGTLISPFFEDFLSEVGQLDLREVLQTLIFQSYSKVYTR